MSIDDDLQPQPSITEGDRALSLFTGRYSFIRLIAERLNDPPAQDILFFHGAGGNGKSLLLAYLRQNSCKKLTDKQWKQWRDFDDEQLATALKRLLPTGHFPVPTALLDFAPGAKRRNTDPFYGLIRIREDLVAAVKETPYTLKFPLHTYGCFLYLKKTNRLEEAKGLFPSEEAALLKEFGDLLKPIPGTGFAVELLNTINKYSGGRLTHYQKKFRLDEVEVQRLQAMDAEKALILELPRLLAVDLNVAMTKTDSPARVVLFFDTHEAFYGRDRNFTDNFFRDGWLRRLLRKLELEAGIVVIIAGRDKPRWSEADEHELGTKIPAEYVCLRSVDNLLVADADIYLRRAGIADEALRDRLIRYASVQAGEVHPLHLGLCVDVVLEAQSSGAVLQPGDFSTVEAFEEKSAYLISQLLKYVDDNLKYAIRALAACRFFDFEIYKLLGNRLDFAVNTPTFKRLLGFSFIRQVAQSGCLRYRVHDLLRRLDKSSTMTNAHSVLAEHYQAEERVDFIYHVNHLAWHRGFVLWIEIFDEALKLSHYDKCRALVNIRTELIVETPRARGLLLDAEGEYYQTLFFYEEAKHAVDYALLAYEEALLINPKDFIALGRKGLCLTSRADLQVIYSQPQAARHSYIQSIAIYNALLKTSSDHISVLNNKGNALQRLANLYARNSKDKDACSSYLQSLVAYNASHRSSPNLVEPLNNKGSALTSLGKLLVKSSRYKLARKRYERAVSTFELSIEKFPSYAQAFHNKGNALCNIAELQVTLSDHEGACKSYIQSILAYNEALKVAPNLASTFNEKGLSIQRLAFLQARLLKYEYAFVLYEHSINLFNDELERFPHSLVALCNKGNSFRMLADLQVSNLQNYEACVNYSISIFTFDNVLKRSPENIAGLKNRSLALESFNQIRMV